LQERFGASDKELRVPKITGIDRQQLTNQAKKDRIKEYQIPFEEASKGTLYNRGTSYESKHFNRSRKARTC
jgi:hypothetical protein